MRLRILHIDFERGRIAIQLHPDDGQLSQLGSFMNACRLRKLEEIQVAFGHGMSYLQTLTLRELCEQHDAMMLPGGDPVVARDGHDVLYSSPPTGPSSAGDSLGTIEYHLRLQNPDTAVAHVTTAAVLIEAASDLGRTARSHLRLCLHELATNSVEHGVFGSVSPRIAADVRIQSDEILLSYSDNATRFETVSSEPLDVARKIEEGHKRGLGLYILNQLAESIEYERVDEWNVTVLKLVIRDAPDRRRERRPSMESVTVDVISCDQPGTVMIKPKGSIDSSGTLILEAQIESLIEQGNLRIVVDFSGVDFISSSGVGVFLGSVSRLRGSGGDLFFMRLPRHIDEVFDIINLKSYFVTLESLDELSTTENAT